MVKIRLSRAGRRNFAMWRVGVYDSHTRRDGRAVEELGSYNPHAEKAEDKLHVDLERVRYWLGKGAQPSPTMASLLKKMGVEV